MLPNRTHSTGRSIPWNDSTADLSFVRPSTASAGIPSNQTVARAPRLDGVAKTKANPVNVCISSHRIPVMPHLFRLVLLLPLCSEVWAADHVWPLDSVNVTGLLVQGDVSAAEGAEARSLVFNGNSLLKVKNSEELSNGNAGYTLSVWANPYLLSGRQQMIAAKNRYSLDERQWSLMLDRDNRFRLYVYQDQWVTVDHAAPPEPGHWHLLAVVVRPDRAELWVNGKLTGTAKLRKPVPQTKAPLTFAGVDDNGQIRQTFVGALDAIRLYNRPLNAARLAAAYKPVSKTHRIPERPQPVRLWSGADLPTGSQAEVLRDVEFRVIKKYEPDVDGYGFLHGVALAWHKDRLYASFGHNRGSENTLTEEGRYCVSEDAGRTWSDVRTIDVGVEDDDLAVSHGVFLSRDETLWAFLGSFHGTRQGVHTRAYTLNEESGRWQSHGTVLRDGFWPMTEPVPMDDGNWIMPGFIVGEGHPAAVAISQGDDLQSWKTVVIPRGADLQNMWGESSIVVHGRHVTNIARYGGRALALVATSSDFGRTWTPSAESNLPMAGSKPCAGRLSTDQRYLICSTTADGGNRRSPLTIAVSKSGENTFSKVFVIRRAVFPGGPGESDPRAALSYPYAVEYQDKLYVGYSNNGGRRGNHNSAELAVIPIQQLAIE